MRLIDSPAGLFFFDGIMVLKTEYSSESNGTVTPDCYIVDSGEYFWGGVDTMEERNALEVTPVDVLVLPCKVGDTVWFIGTECDQWNCWEYGDHCHIGCEKCKTPKIKETIIKQVRLLGNQFDGMTDTTALASTSSNDFYFRDIGKTVFLTREEAEAALAKMDGGDAE